jgi:hypothetical protein
MEQKIILGNIDITHLLKSGASIDEVNLDGKTALDLAKDMYNKEAYGNRPQLGIYKRSVNLDNEKRCIRILAEAAMLKEYGKKDPDTINLVHAISHDDAETLNKIDFDPIKTKIAQDMCKFMSKYIKPQNIQIQKYRFSFLGRKKY